MNPILLIFLCHYGFCVSLWSKNPDQFGGCRCPAEILQSLPKIVVACANKEFHERGKKGTVCRDILLTVTSCVKTFLEKSSFFTFF